MSEKTFQEARARYREYVVHVKGNSARTAQVYDLALDRLAEFMGDTDPLKATHDHLVLFSSRWLFDKGVTAAGRKPYVAAVRGFYKWAAGPGGLIDRNPANAIEYAKTASKLPVHLRLFNAEKLLHQPDLSTFMGLRDSAIMHILIGCGIRVSALVGINEEDFIADVVNGEPRLFLRVREKRNQEQIKLLPQEADLVVRMYLDHPELQAIDRTIQEGPHKGCKVLFVALRNNILTPDENVGETRRMSRQAINDLIAAHGKRAGIPADQLHPHAMRHLFGTELIEGDVDISRVQKMIGHKDIKNTQIYIHLAAAKMAKELDRANPLAKIKTPISQFIAQLKPSKVRDPL